MPRIGADDEAFTGSLSLTGEAQEIGGEGKKRLTQSHGSLPEDFQNINKKRPQQEPFSCFNCGKK